MIRPGAPVKPAKNWLDRTPFPADPVKILFPVGFQLNYVIIIPGYGCQADYLPFFQPGKDFLRRIPDFQCNLAAPVTQLYVGKGFPVPGDPPPALEDHVNPFHSSFLNNLFNQHDRSSPSISPQSP